MSPVIRCPEAVRWIVRRLEDAGFETWAVGGAVRDALAEHPTEDWDFATAARPADVRRLFRRTVPVGIEHGTVGVLAADGHMYEVTTFRRDVVTDGRHARVAFADTVDEDLARRDFTINALAWHPFRDEVLDPFHGQDDLRAGRLRTVGDPATRFAEDYLRVLRAVRFAGRFELRIEEDTWRALCAATPHLGRLSAERIREELLKTLGSCVRPSGALALLHGSGAVETLIPELAQADPGALELALPATDLVPATRPLVRLAVWMSAIGEAGEAGGAGEPGRASGAGAVAGAAGAILERLRFSRAEIATVVGIVRGMSLGMADPGDPVAMRRWCSAVGRDQVRPVLGALVARERVRAGQEGRGLDRLVPFARACRQALRSGVPLSVQELSLDGRALIRAGLKPGPRFGQILDALLDAVLVEPEMDDPGRLTALALSLAEGKSGV